MTKCLKCVAEWPVTLADEKPVCAVTTMDDELYVARTGSYDIDVFDVQSFSLRRRLTIASVQPRSLASVVSFGHASCFAVADMTSCRHYHCLYVADGSGRLVHRLDRRNGKQVTIVVINVYKRFMFSIKTRFNVFFIFPTFFI